MEPMNSIVTALGPKTGWWEALPSADTPGNDDVPAVLPDPEAPVRRLSRRRFVQSVLVLGGALSLNGLQVLSGIKLRPAGAMVGSEYTDCAGYSNWNGYNNNTLVCVGGAYSYIYCGSDGWFKYGYFDGGYTYYTPITICGNGIPKRNAWRWPHGPYRYRCADGNFYYYSSGRWVGPLFKICSQWIGYA
jgi:hypothetical protein